MSLDPPKVMLEVSFLTAVADSTHAQHDVCVATYLHLVREYEHERLLLVAVGDHLRTFDLGESPDEVERTLWFMRRRRSTVFAPVDPLHVAWQHRRAIGRMHDMPSARGLTVLMCERHKVRRIATVDPAFAEFALQIVELIEPVGPVGDAEVAADSPDEPGPDGDAEVAADAG